MTLKLNLVFIFVILKSINSCEIKLSVCVDMSNSVEDITNVEKILLMYYQKLSKRAFSFVDMTNVSFAYDLFENYRYGTYSTKSDIEDAIMNMTSPMIKGFTLIGKCMNYIYRKIGLKQKYKNVILVITDGNPSVQDSPKINTISPKMREKGFFTQAMGLEYSSKHTLLIIAGDENNMVYKLDSENAEKKIDFLVNGICEEYNNKTCTSPPNIKHSNTSYDDKCSDVSVGETCYISCESNYIKIGENPKCNEKLKWVNVPECGLKDNSITLPVLFGFLIAIVWIFLIILILIVNKNSKKEPLREKITKDKYKYESVNHVPKVFDPDINIY